MAWSPPLPVARKKMSDFWRFRTREPYKLEASGFICILAEVPNSVLKRFTKGLVTAAQVLRSSSLKAGHTNDLERRQRQYQHCAGEKTTHIWVGSYKATRRYFTERWLHLRLFCAGGVRTPFVVPCKCQVRHREYLTFPSVGGLAALDAEMQAMGKATGESFTMTQFPSPGQKGRLHKIFKAILKS
ncbi:hypothetical protein K438DRAFT_1992221 [Mycena galopus ATCC 62051]|nr:hypothetical protein K438DRAFT_1992221 [Mycena galopus ATCC 62051]